MQERGLATNSFQEKTEDVVTDAVKRRKKSLIGDQKIRVGTASDNDDEVSEIEMGFNHYRESIDQVSIAQPIDITSSQEGAANAYVNLPNNNMSM